MSDGLPRSAAQSDEEREGIAGKTAYRIVGTGEPVVFVHGCGLRKEAWDPQVAALRATHRVIVYDLLGHGESGLGAPLATFAAFSAQLAELLDALSVDAANLVGHSLGGLIALDFALACPERVRRLAVLNAVYNRPPGQRAAVLKRAADIERDGPRGGETDQTLARWFGASPDRALGPVIRRVRTWLESAGPGYASAYRLFAAEGDRMHVGRLGSLPMPVLYLTGELDPNSTPEMSRRMAAETPHGQAVTIAGERHLMAMAAPDKVNAALRKFLQERPAQGREFPRIGALP